MSRVTQGIRRPNLSRETKFSGANGGRKISNSPARTGREGSNIIIPVQLTTTNYYILYGVIVICTWY